MHCRPACFFILASYRLCSCKDEFAKEDFTEKLPGLTFKKCQMPTLPECSAQQNHHEEPFPCHRMLKMWVHLILQLAEFEIGFVHSNQLRHCSKFQINKDGNRLLIRVCVHTCNFTCMHKHLYKYLCDHRWNKERCSKPSISVSKAARRLKSCHYCGMDISWVMPSIILCRTRQNWTCFLIANKRNLSARKRKLKNRCMRYQIMYKRSTHIPHNISASNWLRRVMVGAYSWLLGLGFSRFLKVTLQRSYYLQRVYQKQRLQWSGT